MAEFQIYGTKVGVQTNVALPIRGGAEERPLHFAAALLCGSSILKPAPLPICYLATIIS